MKSSSAAKQLRKETGSHFTPEVLARYIADRLVSELTGTSGRLRVMDPSCGDGELLLAMHEALSPSLRERAELLGVDQDHEAIETGRARLSDRNAVHDLTTADFLEIALNASDQASLWDSSSFARYSEVDVIIANPPYVRTQVLGSNRAQQLALRFGLSGRVDLYHAFLVGMTATLRAGGILGVVTSNRYLTTQGGASIRSFLAHQYDILQIVDLGDTKLFEAAVLPALFFGRKREAPRAEPQSVPFIRVYESDSLTARSLNVSSAESVMSLVRKPQTATVSVASKIYSVACGESEITTDDKAWALVTRDEDKWLTAVDAAAFCRFADVANIRVGVKTTADAVFIRKDWDNLPPDIRPEEEVLKPIVSRTSMKGISQECGELSRILYTHETINGKRRVIDFERRFPRAWRYLLTHRERLESRKYVTEAGRNWFEIWVPQQPADWALPKLVFPDISATPRFCFDRGGQVVDGNCYWAVIPDQRDELLFLMIAVANSDLMIRYHELAFQNMLYSGRRRYLTQYVSKYPLPDPSNTASQNIIAVVRDHLENSTGSLVCDIAVDERLISDAFEIN